ncbi:response regulator transcription factor [Mucilaginibacter sp. BJC16-A38]|uniref:response regulator n=1 Tax=Mucilaginibacter phenanthrenivorans TaxID=1234842 RepID=UPI00215818E7|nr:response regulator transcription factor [Mucilaginibacter phenanthrenivorans]MCR8560947.1 response regulator transcription factor [Mucilaginibacter phenanthrenivorans]
MAQYQFPISILIADDHRLITDGLATILGAEKDISEIYTADNGRDAVELVMQHAIDCVIMDVDMPILNGLEATKQIKQQKPNVKIIVVSMLSDAAIVNKLLRAGADAFINKESGKAELLKAINVVINGKKYISPEISAYLFTRLSGPKADQEETVERQLTPRELEIIRHIADGLTNQEIAGKLFLSTVTVDTHRKNMLAKLNLKNTASLVRYAAEHGLLK